PDDRIASAPLQVWVAAKTSAESKIWPMSVLARRKLRKAIWLGLDISADAACEPEQDLGTLLDLAGRRADMEVRANSLSGKTPWQGLETDTDFATRALEAGRRLRECVTRLASFGRDLVETREQFARALCDGREGLEAG